jgi:hypothetical protein
MAIAPLLQRAWSWSGRGNTAGTARTARNVRAALALPMRNSYSIRCICKFRMALVQCSNSLLQRSINTPTLAGRKDSNAPSDRYLM